ncbi:MAG: hypothetical protein IPM92_02605 [Saprospiraceae bacterium]|nr:hypothetical protein [Saprospiraceae bacterium]
MNTLIYIAGFDPQIMNFCNANTKRTHALIGLMLVCNTILFFWGAYQFFCSCNLQNWILIPISLILCLLLLGYYRMLLATHDFDHCHYYLTGELKKDTPGFSAMIRILLLLVFAGFSATGLSFWFMEDAVSEFLLKTNTDTDPTTTSQLLMPGTTYIELAISDKLNLIYILLQPWHILIYFYFIVFFILMTLPVAIKFFDKGISFCDYEWDENKIETDIILSNHLYTRDVVNQLRYELYHLGPDLYEAYADPPFNKIKKEQTKVNIPENTR